MNLYSEKGLIDRLEKDGMDAVKELSGKQLEELACRLALHVLEQDELSPKSGYKAVEAKRLWLSGGLSKDALEDARKAASFSVEMGWGDTGCFAAATIKAATAVEDFDIESVIYSAIDSAKSMAEQKVLDTLPPEFFDEICVDVDGVEEEEEAAAAREWRWIIQECSNVKCSKAYAIQEIQQPQSIVSDSILPVCEMKKFLSHFSASVSTDEFLLTAILPSRLGHSQLEAIFRKNETVTAEFVLRCESLFPSERLFAVLSMGTIPDIVVEEFFCRCAMHALAACDSPDPRSIRAVATKRSYLVKKSSLEDLDQANDEAEKAIRFSANKKAAECAFSCSLSLPPITTFKDAAESAGGYIEKNNEFEWQILQLSEMLNELKKEGLC